MWLVLSGAAHVAAGCVFAGWMLVVGGGSGDDDGGCDMCVRAYALCVCTCYACVCMCVCVCVSEVLTE